jgi:hypothetical protein
MCRGAAEDNIDRLPESERSAAMQEEMRRRKLWDDGIQILEEETVKAQLLNSTFPPQSDQPTPATRRRRWYKWWKV